MARYTSLVALRDLPNHGAVAGEVFVSTPVQAVQLINLRHARLAKASERAVAAAADRPRSRRQYRRRDMVAGE